MTKNMMAHLCRRFHEKRDWLELEAYTATPEFADWIKTVPAADLQKVVLSFARRHALLMRKMPLKTAKAAKRGPQDVRWTDDRLQQLKTLAPTGSVPELQRASVVMGVSFAAARRTWSRKFKDQTPETTLSAK